ncbi:NADAR family protein, partial [Patescibacteria group bacterium]|nr:NADAR family protein [Patescibacteria group bacterium]
RSYRSVEHYYQSHKTSDLSIQEEIRLAPTAGKSKKLGRKCVCDIDWDSKKDDVMRYALRMKFTGELKDDLISTSPAILEEGNSWGDTYWGICNGEGQNKLGQFLMELRSILEDEFSSPSSLIPGCQYDSNCGKCPHFRPCELRLRVEDYPIKVITFTGNRNLALNDVKKNLQEIHDSNPGTIWVTGMAYGLDLAVAKFAADNGIPFEAHLPFPAHIQISKWDLPTQKLHTALLEKASAVFTHSDKFSMQAYQLRNIKMADKADLVVAFNRNKKGGTVNMINYCKKSKIPIIDGFTHQYFSEGV